MFDNTFPFEQFQRLGLNTEWEEQYVSVSKTGVLRGPHFQAPPCNLQKIVLYLDGSKVHVIVDLRKSSETDGQHGYFELNAFDGFYVPKGFAHGFCVPTALSAIMLYSTTNVYNSDLDTGLRWNDFAIYWPVRDPTVSHRNKHFCKFSEFVSPFI